ncbi:MAG: class I SAM-dependent methyltransferase [Elusimicrobiales bacterium]|jgi:SAM-dependent methyltransferase
MLTAQTAYFERKARGYLQASGRGLWGRLRSAEWEALRACLDPAPGLSALDAGCGPGYYSLRLRGAGMEVGGIDPSPAMLAQYRAHGFDGRLGSIETFGTGRRYDRVLIAGVLEFVERPARALANMAGLLRADGRLVCLVPATGTAGTVYKVLHRLLGCPVFIREPSAYLRMAQRCGLTPVKSAKATPISFAFALQRSGRGRN